MGDWLLFDEELSNYLDPSLTTPCAGNLRSTKTFVVRANPFLPVWKSRIVAR